MKQTDRNADTKEPHSTYETRPWLTTTSDSYAHELYRNEVEDQDIERFLKEMGAYSNDQGRWWISDAPETREDLMLSVLRVVRSVLESFVKATDAEIRREVVETHVAQGGEGVTVAPTFPELVVQAAGPSFEIPDSRHAPICRAPALGYSNVATYFSVKLDCNVGIAEECMQEATPHARRIFREQPNRRHVRSLVITEKQARVVHFDRAGCQITPPFDIHKDPETLIRLFVGLASIDERVLGLDDSVQWTIIDGRKSQGTLITTSPNGDRKSYHILEYLPIPQSWIFGKGTTCWRVQDPDTLEEFVIKDSWRSEDRAPERELLEQVRGVAGVVQMVAHETRRGGTKDFRCPTTSGDCCNRIAERVTVKADGRSIDHFKSTTQLLCALRDAIAGHQRLVGEDLSILHRDISVNNILLGVGGAPEGERGVIIDLDLAFKATEERPYVSVDHNMGTRVFQSLWILQSHSMRCEKYAHDYLDDLESFFCIVAYLFLLFRPDGICVSSKDEGPSVVYPWANHCAFSAAHVKEAVFGWGKEANTALRVTKQRWGPACFALFEQFRQWVVKVRREKRKLLFDIKRAGRSDTLDPLYAQRDEHYATVLKMFDDAIEVTRTPSTPPHAPAHAAESHHTCDPASSPNNGAVSTPLDPHSQGPTCIKTSSTPATILHHS